MEKNITPQPPKSSDKGRIWAGVIILTVGCIMLFKQLDLNIHFPSWLTNGKIILILIGLVIGAKTSFKNPVSYVFIGIGTFLIVRDELNFNLFKVLFPAIIIGVGAWLLTDRSSKRRKKPRTHDPLNWDVRQPPYSAWNPGNTSDTNSDFDPSLFSEKQSQSQHGSTDYSNSEYVRLTAIFSEVKKTIVTKNFKGGNIVNIFGGTDINLMQTDLQAPVVIDVFQIFAGTKIIVPANWRVVSEVVSVFGEIDDRRFALSNFKDDQKVVYLRGTSIFAGITIKSM